MPLDFFLESGDGGDIGNGLVPWEPFDRDVPAKFRCSAVSFSVSAKVGALALRLRSRLGALAVLFPLLILKKPRPNEDLALRVPKGLSSTEASCPGTLGGRVPNVRLSVGALSVPSDASFFRFPRLLDFCRLEVETPSLRETSAAAPRIALPCFSF